MKSVIKRMTVVCMAFVMMLSMMPLLGAVTNGAVGAQKVYAEPHENVEVKNFKFDLYDDFVDPDGTAHGSVWVKGYNGSKTEIILPSTVEYDGKKFSVNGSAFDVYQETFKNNTTLNKVVIPPGYCGVKQESFSGCSGLTEVSIGSMNIDGNYDGFGADVFKGCSNLKTYHIDSTGFDEGINNGKITENEVFLQIMSSGIGTDSEGNPISGVVLYTQENSAIYRAIDNYNTTRGSNPIILENDSNPYTDLGIDMSDDGGGDTPTPPSGGDTPSGGGTNPPANDGSAAAIEKTIRATGSEKDVKGSTFSLLQARAKKVGKTSVTLGWSKPKGAKSYVVYGNTCSKKHKYVKLATTGKNSIPVKKILKNKVKKGTYYKFIIVALDANGNVVATSKTVHAATTGGKVGNDKAVNTAARKNKVSIKKGKSFKLKAKAVAASKKLKVKKHRGVAYESSDPAVAKVSSKGVIKGKKKGSCYVYAYAQNGVFRKIKVTIK